MALGVHVEERPDRCVELGVHEDHVLAVAEGLQHHVGAELDRSGDIHEGVDLLRAAEEKSVVRDDWPSRANGVLQLTLRRRHHAVLEAGVCVHLGRTLEAPAVDGRDLHSGDAVHDGVGEPLGHESGADHSHTDRASLALAGLEQVVDDHHRSAPPVKRSSWATILALTSVSISDNRGQTQSFSEISLTGSGQLRPRAGSS